AGDVLNVNDRACANVAAYTVTATTVDWGGIARLTYNAVDALRLNTGTNADTVNVQGTARGTDTTVNLGPGANTVNVGAANRLDSAEDRRAGKGVPLAGDVLNVNDQTNPNVAAYTVTDTTVDWGRTTIPTS